MKKVIYTLLLVAVCTLSFTACSEEEIKPSTELENGGGNGFERI
jgi:hypothetical protein